MHMYVLDSGPRCASYAYLFLQIFGEDVQDASVTEDLLVITTHSHRIRYYSFKWILDNVRNTSVLIL